MKPFATIDDVTQLWRPLRPDETERAKNLLEVVSDNLRVEADKVGVDLDEKLADKPVYKSVARSVTVDVVARTLMTSTDMEPMVQTSQSAGGYTASGTFLVPGGGIFIKKSELARLGLRQQKMGLIDIYGISDKGHHGCAD